MKCCPSGEQVLGVCGCCPTCAKAENESCGGEWGLEGTCAPGFYCRGEMYDGFPRDGICTKIEHEGQYQTHWERSDNPEWHKSVPTCDNPTYETPDCGCASIEVYHNGPLEYTHRSIYGYYVRQEDLINERPWFKNNGKSIWWDTKYWRLGWTNRTGGQRSHAKLYNDERCLPKDSDQEWNLYDSNANWSNAGNKLRIRCGYKPKGNQPNLLLKWMSSRILLDVHLK